MLARRPLHLFTHSPSLPRSSTGCAPGSPSQPTDPSPARHGSGTASGRNPAATHGFAPRSRLGIDSLGGSHAPSRHADAPVLRGPRTASPPASHRTAEPAV